MRLYMFDDHRLGVLAADGGLVDITALVGERVRPADRMTELIENWLSLRGQVAAALASSATLNLASVTLLAPQPCPRLLVAAPVNYRRHQQEMGGDGGVYPGLVAHTIETYAGFVKASSSIIGPSGAIELPLEDRRVDHEAELGVLIGRTATRVDRSDALEYVFGYVPLLDITLRGDEDRSFRKSFDTFTPIGPAIVTADEIRDPDALTIRLSVNGALRQQANTRDMIYGVAQLVELYSAAMTLRPGDIIATGTPEGVGRIVAGDEIVLTIDNVGRLTMPVTRRQPPLARDTVPRVTAI
jgi:2-keto-4-pentenoate hydratase/2-oxohepta-3-ene-1,7-dioic acid hydratase in catechol pathway